MSLSAPVAILSGFELHSRKPEESAAFYSWLRGAKQAGGSPDSVRVIHDGPTEITDSWVAVFSVTDPDRAVRRIESAFPGTTVVHGEDTVYVQDEGGVWSGLRLRPPDEDWSNTVEPSTGCELAAGKSSRSVQFVARLLELDAIPIPFGPFQFQILHDNGRPVVGVIDLGPHSRSAVQPHWLPYFRIEDVDLQTARAVESGSRVVVPPSNAPRNRYAVLVDPFGVVFGLSRRHAPGEHVVSATGEVLPDLDEAFARLVEEQIRRKE